MRANYVTQSNPFGSYVCGTRGGDSWVNVTRPDFETKKCPKDTEPCSKKTSVDNTVCYPKKDHASKCPINHFEFTKSGSSFAATQIPKADTGEETEIHVPKDSVT
jgi:hypothetical protein